MLTNPLLLSGEEFVEFCYAKVADGGLDALCPSSTVRHSLLGNGTVEGVKLRVNQPPLFTIRFLAPEKRGSFNLDAFKKVISSVELPPAANALVQEWREEQERRQAAEALRKLEREAAEKVELEYRRETETRVEPFDWFMAREYVDFAPSLSAREAYENEQIARVSYYREKLPHRIDWLKEWAHRITEGEPGLEPFWSEGRASAHYLEQQGVSHLWHFTHVRNLEQIFEQDGLLSYEGLESLVMPSKRIIFSSNEESFRLDRSLQRLSYVRLSFVPNSYFFQRAKKEQGSSLVWLRFSLTALSLGEISYGEGNCASPYAKICGSPNLFCIDWKELRRFGGVQEGNPPLKYPTAYALSDDDEYKKFLSDTLNSEVLVKHFLPLEFCTGIWSVGKGAWLDF